MVDGNVIRVLTRQLGFYASPKLSSTNALIAQVATLLVQAVSRNDANGEEEIRPSAKPGAWGQALMELGATICKPKPECGVCPISSTCKAYAEGEALAAKAGLCKSSSTAAAAAEGEEVVEDIEDLCTFCEPLEEVQEETVKVSAKAKAAAAKAEAAALKAKAEAKQPKLSFGAAPVKPKQPQPQQEASSTATTTKHSAAAMDVIVSHASRFPMKVVKAAARVEQCAVCVIRDQEGKVLIVQRPEKGESAKCCFYAASLLC